MVSVRVLNVQWCKNNKHSEHDITRTKIMDLDTLIEVIIICYRYYLNNRDGQKDFSVCRDHPKKIQQIFAKHVVSEGKYNPSSVT